MYIKLLKYVHKCLHCSIVYMLVSCLMFLYTHYMKHYNFVNAQAQMKPIIWKSKFLYMSVYSINIMITPSTKYLLTDNILIILYEMEASYKWWTLMHCLFSLLKNTLQSIEIIPYIYITFTYNQKSIDKYFNACIHMYVCA